MNKLFFVHFVKSGGTTIHSALESLFPKETVSANRGSTPGGLEDADLAQSRFVSGHFSLGEAIRAKDRFGYTCATVLRDPKARIASAYNFLNAHNPKTHPRFLDPARPPGPTFLAVNSMDVSSFFESEVVDKSIMFNNLYTNVLTAPGVEQIGRVPIQAASDDYAKEAISNLRYFDVVKSLDRGVDLINHIRGQMGKPPVSDIRTMKITKDEMSWHEWMRPVELITADDLPPSAERLFRYDKMVYDSVRNIS